VCEPFGAISAAQIARQLARRDQGRSGVVPEDVDGERDGLGVED
jgi:hypothetical protein